MAAFECVTKTLLTAITMYVHRPNPIDNHHLTGWDTQESDLTDEISCKLITD